MSGYLILEELIESLYNDRYRVISPDILYRVISHDILYWVIESLYNIIIDIDNIIYIDATNIFNHKSLNIDL